MDIWLQCGMLVLQTQNKKTWQIANIALMYSIRLKISSYSKNFAEKFHCSIPITTDQKQPHFQQSESWQGNQLYIIYNFIKVTYTAYIEQQ